MGSASLRQLRLLFRRLLDRLAPPERNEFVPFEGDADSDTDRSADGEGPLYVGGSPNPDRLGFIPLRGSSGSEPDISEVKEAASILKSPTHYIDADGYEQEIVAAARDDTLGYLAYVSSCAKEKGSVVDIEFLIHLRNPDGTERAWPIRTYNPYFGCDVRYFRWMSGSAVLIYREKHHTYVCRLAPEIEATFLKIEDDWTIKGNTLAFRKWKAPSVDCVNLPDLRALGSLSLEEAQAAQLLPSDA